MKYVELRIGFLSTDSIDLSLFFGLLVHVIEEFGLGDVVAVVFVHCDPVGLEVTLAEKLSVHAGHLLEES